jgi:hypothetical protein
MPVIWLAADFRLRAAVVWRLPGRWQGVFYDVRDTAVLAGLAALPVFMLYLFMRWCRRLAAPALLAAARLQLAAAVILGAINIAVGIIIVSTGLLVYLGMPIRQSAQVKALVRMAVRAQPTMSLVGVFGGMALLLTILVLLLFLDRALRRTLAEAAEQRREPMT